MPQPQAAEVEEEATASGGDAVARELPPATGGRAHPRAEALATLAKVPSNLEGSMTEVAVEVCVFWVCVCLEM